MPLQFLGLRLKEARLKSNLSLREIARQLNVSPSFISQIENGKSRPSVGTLYALTNLLGINVDDLFDSKSDGKARVDITNRPPTVGRHTFNSPADAWDKVEARISVVSTNNRSKITMDSGVSWERLAATIDGSINFMEIVYEPRFKSDDTNEPLIHGGYEYGLALDGEIEVTVGDLVQVLTKGDSIGFDSTIPHMLRNISKVPFRGIWFVHGCPSPHH